MTQHLDSHRPESSTALARERDAVILRLLRDHPATAGMLTDVGLFPSRKKARKRLTRLLQRHLIRYLGTVSFKTGRPEQVYGRGRWKGDTLFHEVQLTRVLLKIHADEVRRAPGAVDGQIRPDAELLINGERYFVELDCGTMGYSDIVEKRFSKYQTMSNLVLWVCPSPARLEGLRRNAAILRETALFTTLDQALRDPHSPIWIDVDGETGAVPRGGREGYAPG